MSTDDDEKQQSVSEYGRWLANPAAGDEVVIAGLSGCFPESANVYEFRDNLFNKTDMVNADTRRWLSDHPEIPQRTGKLKMVDKFDAGYFGIHYRQIQTMDPMQRMFLEKAIEAIIDAGLHPSEIEGTNTGVFLGACFSETEKNSFYQNLQPQKFGITGATRTMIANRVSYHLKLNGPSFITDTACSSSLYALEHAYRSIRNGDCDNALVGGTQVCLHPIVSLQFKRLGVLSADGSCKVFDQDANGYARSEAIGCILLQKSRNARRIYAKILHAKLNCDGYKEQGITFPSSENQRKLLEEFYEECPINPDNLTFLEAHGTGTQVGDPEEIVAIDEVLAKKRAAPLLVGSVKSNIGHSEPSAGICSVTKVLIAMESGHIPPNINFNRPKDSMEGLQKGRMKVVTEKTPFPNQTGIIGINSFGFGGGNCHVLLQWNMKSKKNSGSPKDHLPRLICVSGRVDDAVSTILDDVVSRKLDAEFVGLLHGIFSKNFPTHHHRGYSIVSKTKELARSYKYSPYKSDVYLSLNLDPNWNIVGQTLFGIPQFAASIQKYHNYLLEKNLNITQIIMDNSNQVLGTITVLMGIIDLFKHLDIQFKQISGESYLKLLCGYHDDVISLEETLNAALEIAAIIEPIQPKIIENPLKEFGKKPNSFAPIPNGQINEKLGKLNGESASKPSDSKVFRVQFGGENGAFPDGGDHLVGFFKILGSLYECGQQPQIHKLYPQIQVPVSRATPMISPLIRWQHAKEWHTCRFKISERQAVGEKKFEIFTDTPFMSYLSGHEIDGRNLFPATGYLELAWITFANSLEMQTDDLAVVFENCRFMRATTVSKTNIMELLVTVQKKSGNFEIIEGESPVVSGRIFSPKDITKYQTELPLLRKNRNGPEMGTKDIYKELKLRGYHYKGDFRGLLSADSDAKVGQIKWDRNWVTFIDAMMQMKILQTDTRLLYVPTFIKMLSINPKEHLDMVPEDAKDFSFPLHIYQNCNTIRCGAIEIRGLLANSIPRRKNLGQPVLEKYQFIPYDAQLNLPNSLRVIMQIILENSLEYKIKAVELIDDHTNPDLEPLLPTIHHILGDLPLIQPDLTIYTKNKLEELDTNVKIEDKKLIEQTDCLLVIGSGILERLLVLQQAFGAISKTGYILSRESSRIPDESHKGIEILAQYHVENEYLILFRKCLDYKMPTTINIGGDPDEWIPKLQTIKNHENVLIFVENDPENGILGLVNCLRREGGANIRCCFVTGNSPKFDVDTDFYRQQLRKNLAINVWQNGQWGSYRHLLIDNMVATPNEHCYANVMTRGDLSSLKWIHGPLSSRTSLKPGESLVTVYCAALNFRDIMTASGKINADAITLDRLKQECVQGFEYSGRDPEGNRLMGVVISGALSTLVVADKYLMWNVPDGWSLEEAATVPVVYATVCYALLYKCTIQPGDSILIHSGTGGIGLAAINLCLYYKCNIFVTVGTKEKRQYLLEHYPDIPDEHIGNSRDLSFEKMILKQTWGRGVDYVLNSLAGDKLLASVRCLAHGGKFVEIGKYDLVSNTELNLLLLEKSGSYHSIMIDQLFTEEQSVKGRITRIFTKALESGLIKPLPRTVFNTDNLEQAFRFMATGKHIGKVMIKIRDEEMETGIKPTISTISGIPRYWCQPDKVYIILGGLGGFGLELADWLVLRGAKNLILTSRHGVRTGYQYFRLKIWKSYCVNVQISTVDITTRQGCTDLIRQAQTMGAIDAIFNLAVILKDGLFENQTIENFKISLAPKASATKHLDQITRQLCPNLRHFIVFSSVSCGRGNPGQTNYGMANSMMERVCEQRRRDGLHGLAIEWGAIGEVGLVAELQDEHVELEIGGTLQQRISSCLDVLDQFLFRPEPVLASMVVAEKRAGAGGASCIVEAVANILGINDLKTVSQHSTLAELGMDSMTAVEIKNVLEREFDVYLTAQDIRSMTFARLYEIQLEQASDGAGDKKKERKLEGVEMLIQCIPNEDYYHAPVRIPPNGFGDDPSGSAEKILLFPGLEGVLDLLEPFTKNVRANFIGFQYGFMEHTEHIKDLVDKVLPHVDEHLNMNEPFKIVAHSFGTIVALEIVSILEQRGLTGDVVLIDGSPEMLCDLIKKFLHTQTQSQFETAIVCQLMTSYFPIETIIQNKDIIANFKTFEERIEYAQKLAPKDTPYSPEFQKIVPRALYQRLKSLTHYQVNYPRLKSSIKLYKPQFTGVTNIEDDYGLNKLTIEPIDMAIYYGNHISILENLDMAEDISKRLDLIRDETEEMDVDKGVVRDEKTI